MSQVIVVGGGLAGLSAAHTLLERGANVLLLDKQGCVVRSFSHSSHNPTTTVLWVEILLKLPLVSTVLEQTPSATLTSQIPPKSSSTTPRNLYV